MEREEGRVPRARSGRPDLDDVFAGDPAFISSDRLAPLLQPVKRAPLPVAVPATALHTVRPTPQPQRPGHNETDGGLAEARKAAAPEVPVVDTAPAEARKSDNEAKSTGLAAEAVIDSLAPMRAAGDVLQKRRARLESLEEEEGEREGGAGEEVRRTTEHASASSPNAGDGERVPDEGVVVDVAMGSKADEEPNNNNEEEEEEEEVPVEQLNPSETGPQPEEAERPIAATASRADEEVEAEAEEADPPPNELRKSTEGRERQKKGTYQQCRTVGHEEKAKQMRVHISKEILSSEMKYVHNLDFLIKNFKDSLTSENAASPEEVDSIFSNITLIWNFNKTLLAELETQFAIAEESPNLGKVFLDMAWLQQANTKSGKTGDLASYLIQPVQRLPRYILLLQDLIHNTPCTHTDYNTLLAALQKARPSIISQICLLRLHLINRALTVRQVREVTKDINEMRRYAENLEKVQTRLTEMAGSDEVPEELVQPSRIYVREGELIRYDRGRRRKQYLYLFNDILLCVDLEAITFWYPWRVDAVASLVGAKVSDCSADPALQPYASPSAREVHAFQVVFRSGEVFTFVCPSQEEKESWFISVQEQITHLEKTRATKQAKLEQLSSSNSSVSVAPGSPHVLREEDFEMIGGKTAPRRSTRLTLLKEGYLTKQGGFFPSWKRRWFILRRNRLAYYENRENSLPLGFIDLRRFRVHRIETYSHAFELRPELASERTYRMAADTAQDCDEWMAVLKMATAMVARSSSGTPARAASDETLVTASGRFTPSLRVPLSFPFFSPFRDDEKSRADPADEDSSDYSDLEADDDDEGEEEKNEGTEAEVSVRGSGGKKKVSERREKAKEKAGDDDDEGEGEWTCPRCTFVNRPSFLVCDVCNEIRDFREQSKRFSQRDDDYRDYEEEEDGAGNDGRVAAPTEQQPQPQQQPKEKGVAGQGGGQWLIRFDDVQKEPEKPEPKPSAESGDSATTNNFDPAPQQTDVGAPEADSDAGGGGGSSSPGAGPRRNGSGRALDARNLLSVDTNADFNLRRRTSVADEDDDDRKTEPAPPLERDASSRQRAATTTLVAAADTAAAGPAALGPGPGLADSAAAAGDLDHRQEKPEDFSNFAEQLSGKRINPMMAQSLLFDRGQQRSRRGKKAPAEGDGDDKAKTLDSALLMRLRSATASGALASSKSHSLKEPCRARPSLASAEQPRLCAKPAEALVHVWSNQKTVSGGEVTFLNPVVDGDSGFLGFVARPYWLEAPPGQTITSHELREADQARGTACPSVWTYTDLTTISPPPPPSDTAAAATPPPQRGVVNASSPSPSSFSSASASTPLLVRPASYRLLWKDTGLNSRARCSIWRPLPPSDDYVAVGFLVADAYKTPDPERTNLRSLLQEARVNPQPVWTNRNSSSHYKLSIWQVAALDATADRGSGGGSAPDRDYGEDRFFVAVSGHDPPTTPVYIIRPGLVLPWRPTPSIADDERDEGGRVAALPPS